MDEVRHLNDDELRAWWTERFTALVADSLPAPVRDLVFATRAAAAKREPALDADDNAVVTELIPTIPEAVGFRPPGS